MQVVAFSGQFKFTGTSSVSVIEQVVGYVMFGVAGSFFFTGGAVVLRAIEQDVEYVTYGDAGSFGFTGGSVVLRRVIPKVRGKGRNK